MTVQPEGSNPPYAPGNSSPPAPYVPPAQVIEPARVVTPTAVATGKSSAVHDMGQVLKHLISNSHYFPNENAVDEAMNTVDRFVNSFVPAQEFKALLDGTERAAKEDVTKRTPPGGPMPVLQAAPAIDYDKLATALLAAQRRLALEAGE
jgi:hypothetical protein